MSSGFFYLVIVIFYFVLIPVRPYVIQEVEGATAATSKGVDKGFWQTRASAVLRRLVLAKRDT